MPGVNLPSQLEQILYAFRKTRDYLATVIEDKKVGHLVKADIRRAHHHLCLWLNDFNLRVMSAWWPTNTYSFKWTVKLILRILQDASVQEQVSSAHFYAEIIRAALRGDLFGMEGGQGVSTPSTTTIQGSATWEEYVQALEEKGG